MKHSMERRALCANEGCGRPVEEGSRFCASCGLEWMLFHRDAREKSAAIESPAVMAPDLAFEHA